MRPLFILSIWLLTCEAQADLYWQPESAKGGGHRGTKMFYLVDHQPAAKLTTLLLHSDLQSTSLQSTSLQSTSLQSTSLQSTSLQSAHDSYQIKGTGKNNYHALIAREQGEGYQHMAVRYLYFNGRPVNSSPSDLLAYRLGDLEITPDPLPREHSSYTSGKQYSFLLQFQGEPLAEQPVLVMTEFGSTDILHSDRSGVLKIVIPNDFPEVKPGRRVNPPGELRLFSEFEQGGVNYQTSLSSEYRVGSETWKNTGYGTGIALGGLLFGLWLNRRLPEQSRRKKG